MPPSTAPDYENRKDRRRSLDPPPDLTGRIGRHGRETIAVGGYSTVYKVSIRPLSDALTTRYVVVKALRAAHAVQAMMNEKLKKRLDREIRVWARLRHPNVVPLLGYVLDEEGPGLVSPWYANGNALQFLKVCPVANREILCLDIAMGLNYLHSHKPQIIHGDIKSANVLISSDGHACLCDFGLSIVLDDNPSGFSSSTPGGTLRFLAPELLECEEKTVEADIFAYGCLCVEMLFDTNPYPSLQRQHHLIKAISNHETPYEITAEDKGFLLFPSDLLEACWKTKPSERPGIGYIIDSLRNALTINHRFNGSLRKRLGDKICIRSRSGSRYKGVLSAIAEDNTWFELNCVVDITPSTHQTRAPLHVALYCRPEYTICNATYDTDNNERRRNEDSTAIPAFTTLYEEEEWATLSMLFRSSVVPANEDIAPSDPPEHTLAPSLLDISSFDTASTASSDCSDIVSEAFNFYDLGLDDLLLDYDGVVQGGTLPALVARLTQADFPDMYFRDAFMLTFKTFTTVSELFPLLVNRWNVEPAENISQDMENWVRRSQEPTRLRVLNTLKSILQNYEIVATEDHFVLDDIGVFLTKVSEIYPAAKWLLDLIQLIKSGRNGVSCPPYVPSFVTGAPRPIAPKFSANGAYFLLDFNPLETARQLTLLEWTLFREIRERDMFAYCTNRAKPNDSVARLIMFNGQVSQWVRRYIQGSAPQERPAVVRHFVLLADSSRALHNYSTMSAVISGLLTYNHWEEDSLSILGKRGFRYRPVVIFEEMKTFLIRFRSPHAYRQMITQSSSPRIPNIRMYVSALRDSQQSMRDTLDLEGKVINFRKRLDAAAIIQEVRQFQWTPYNLMPVQPIQFFLQNALNHSTHNSPETKIRSSLLQLPRNHEVSLASMLMEHGFL